MSSFSFSHSVFKRLVSLGCQKVSLCGNGLNPPVVLTLLIYILIQDEVELRHVVKSLSSDSEKTSMDVEAFQRLLVTARSVAVARPGNLVKFAEKEASDNEKDGRNFCKIF